MNSAPTTKLEHFAVASDGTSIYLSGGRETQSNTNSNEVWRFNGSVWSQVARSANFTARRRHSMAFHAGALYITGGVAANSYLGTDWLTEGLANYLSDVWRSADGGSSWIQQTPNAQFSPRFGHCNISFGGQLYVIGGFSGESFLDRPLEVWRSNDGASWAKSSSIVNSFSNEQAYGGCAAIGNKIVFSGGTSLSLNAPAQTAIVSDPGSGVIRVSVDGVTWSSEGGIGTRWGHGTAALGSALFMAGGYESDTASILFKRNVWRAP